MWLKIGVAAIHLLLIALCLYPTIMRRHVRYILEHGQQTKARITSVKEARRWRGGPVVYTLQVRYKADGKKQTGTLHPPGLTKKEFSGFQAGTMVPIKYLPDKPNQITLTLPVMLNKMESVAPFANVIGPALAVLFAASGVATLWMMMHNTL